MIGIVKMINIFVSGYEADITIDFFELGKITCGVVLEYEHNPLKKWEKVEFYIEDKPTMEISLDSTVDVEFKIIYGNKCYKIDEIANDSYEYSQDIVNSPHAIFKGKVIENLGNNNVVCVINDSINHINVEFDEGIEDVSVGDFICFSGEFAINSMSMVSET